MSDITFNPAQHLRAKDSAPGTPVSNLGGFVPMTPNRDAPDTVIDSIAAAVAEPAPRIIARFNPQQWRNNYAVDDTSYGPVEFDVTDMVNRMPAAERLSLKDNSEESDQLWQAAVAGGLVSKYEGTGYVDVEWSITDYDDEMRGRSATLDAEDELPSTFIGRQMDDDVYTLAAWDAYARRHGVAAAADGYVSTTDLKAFENDLFGAYTSEAELDEAWENYRTVDMAPLGDSLNVVKTSAGVAGHWS